MEKKENLEVERDICAACGYDMQGAIHCPCCGAGIWTPDMPFWDLSEGGKRSQSQGRNEK